MHKKIGFDIGNVLVSGNHKEVMANNTHLTRSPIEDAFESIAHLATNNIFAASNMFLVSYCGFNTQEKTKEWLHHQRFTEMTGIPDNNWYFVRHRDDKSPLCRALQISHFVDDRIDILKNIRSENEHSELYAFNPQRDLGLAEQNNIHIVKNWQALVSLLTP